MCVGGGQRVGMERNQKALHVCMKALNNEFNISKEECCYQNDGYGVILGNL